MRNLINLLRRDIKFGTEKSIKNILLYMLLILSILFMHTNSSRNFENILNYFILPDFDDIYSIIRNNVYFLSLQFFVMMMFCKYIYDDLFTYGNIVLLRINKREVFCISKVIYMMLINFVIYVFICSVLLAIGNFLGMDKNSVIILFKIVISYTLGAISLGIFNAIISIISKESIACFLCVVFSTVNLILHTNLFPGGGYISVMFKGKAYIYATIYDLILIILLSAVLIKIYRKIDIF